MIGHIRDKGGSPTSKSFSMEFNLTASVQEFIAPKAGLYKLEVWGGQGGNTTSHSISATGGLGGYSVGYKYINKDTTLYVCIGGGVEKNIVAGGYNGGGTGITYGSDDIGSGGGGATHIALTDGTLKEIGYTEFVTNNKGLIVAGGGGGSACDYNDSVHYDLIGGNGGGLSGGNRGGHYGGTQTSAGTNGGFGYGGSNSRTNVTTSGGGGGFYGGGGGMDMWQSGGGGSGWIAGVPAILYKGVSYTPSTENGVNEGNGKAIITFITS